MVRASLDGLLFVGCCLSLHFGITKHLATPSRSTHVHVHMCNCACTCTCPSHHWLHCTVCNWSETSERPLHTVAQPHTGCHCSTAHSCQSTSSRSTHVHVCTCMYMYMYMYVHVHVPFTLLVALCSV